MAHISISQATGPNGKRHWKYGYFAEVWSGTNPNGADYIRAYEWFGDKESAEAWAADESDKQDRAQKAMHLFR